MKKFKCFVSYMTIDGKRVWKMWRAPSIGAATESINLIAQENIVSYVRIERV